MNYLGLDLGDKRTWVSYNVWNIILTLPFIERLKLFKDLKKIVEEKNIDTIVVGLPFDLYWKDDKQLQKTLKVVDKLKEIFPNKNIDTIDERFTTFESYNILQNLNLSKKEMLEKKDSMSAYLILESYLNKKNNQKV